MSIEEPPVSFVCIHGLLGTSANPVLWPSVPLTWNRHGELVRLDGQEPPTQLVVAAVCRANQSDGAPPTGRLVVQRHLFVGQDVIVVCGDAGGQLVGIAAKIGKEEF